MRFLGEGHRFYVAGVVAGFVYQVLLGADYSLIQWVAMPLVGGFLVYVLSLFVYAAFGKESG